MRRDRSSEVEPSSIAAGIFEEIGRRIREIARIDAGRSRIPEEADEQYLHFAPIELAAAGDRLAQHLYVQRSHLNITKLLSQAVSYLAEQGS